MTKTGKVFTTIGTAIVMVFFLGLAMLIAIFLEIKNVYNYGRNKFL